jgi:hypothetical protein
MKLLRVLIEKRRDREALLMLAVAALSSGGA